MSEAVTVAQGAHTDLQCSSNKNSVETSLADYIKTEYPALTKQQPAFYTVPAFLSLNLGTGEAMQSVLSMTGLRSFLNHLD